MTSPRAPQPDDPVTRNRARHPRRHKDRDAVSDRFTSRWMIALAGAIVLATVALAVIVAVGG